MRTVRLSFAGHERTVLVREPTNAEKDFMIDWYIRQWCQDYLKSAGAPKTGTVRERIDGMIESAIAEFNIRSHTK